MRELVALYAIDALDPEEASRVAAALAANFELAAELENIREAMHCLGMCVPQMAPSPEIEAQLMASVGSGRFERFANQIARMYDVAIDRARELLGLIERSSAWNHASRDIGLIHFAGGPSCAGADCGVVRIRAGGFFPLHTHLGEEMSVVVAGVVRDSNGSTYVTGDEIVRQAGTSHALTAEGRDDVILLARAFNGIELAR